MGGISLLVEKTIKHLSINILHNLPDKKITYEDHLQLFGPKFYNVKIEIVKLTNTTSDFENYLRQIDFVDTDEYEINELRLVLKIIFTKYFVVQSDLENDFKQLLMKCIFPIHPVCQLTIDDCRWRLVNYSIRVNQLHIAESALLQSEHDHEFENWMNSKSIFETFFHEAFKERGLIYLTPRLIPYELANLALSHY